MIASLDLGFGPWLSGKALAVVFALFYILHSLTGYTDNIIGSLDTNVYVNQS